MKLRVQVDGRWFDVEIEDLNARPVIARVGEQRFEVWPEQPALVDSTAQAAGEPLSPTPARKRGCDPERLAQLKGQSSADQRLVTAPIPGVVTAFHVQVGDEVQPGQELCVLEAMKMKNIIRASRAGRVAKLLAIPGETVRHRAALLEYTE